MLEFVAEKEAVRFSYNGKQYAMDTDEIEAAYRYQEHQYRLQDAERQLKYLCFGDEVGNEEINSESPRKDIAEALEVFEDRFGMSYSDATKHLEAFVLKFEIGFDCNLTENNQWDNAIREALEELAE